MTRGVAWAGRNALPVATALVLMCASQLARAATRIVPAEDGSLGAWLVAGAIPANAGEKLDATTARPVEGTRLVDQPWAPRWRVVATDDGAINLEKELSAGKKAGPWAMLGGELQLARDLHGWLLLSFDGGATALVDGKPLWSRDVERIRAGSWDAIPLELPKGAHRLTLWLHHRGHYWATAVRVLDRKTLRPPRGLSLVLPGTDSADTTRLARSMLHVELSTGLDAHGYRPEVGFEYRRGAPRDVPLDASVEAHLGGRSLFNVKLGALPVGDRAVHPLRATLPPIAPDARSGATACSASISYSGWAASRRNARCWWIAAPRALLARAAKLASDLRGGAHGAWLDAAVVADTLEQRSERLRRLGHKRHSTEHALGSTLDDLSRLCAPRRAGPGPARDGRRARASAQLRSRRPTAALRTVRARRLQPRREAPLPAGRRAARLQRRTARCDARVPRQRQSRTGERRRRLRAGAVRARQRVLSRPRRARGHAEPRLGDEDVPDRPGAREHHGRVDGRHGYGPARVLLRRPVLGRLAALRLPELLHPPRHVAPTAAPLGEGPHAALVADELGRGRPQSSDVPGTGHQGLPARQRQGTGQALPRARLRRQRGLAGHRPPRVGNRVEGREDVAVARAPSARPVAVPRDAEERPVPLREAGLAPHHAARGARAHESS